MAPAGAAEADRQLIADEFAAEVGEDRRPVSQARAVLLADAGRDGDVCMEVAEKPGFGDFDVFGGAESDASRKQSCPRAKKMQLAGSPG